jgi:signal transduction histidine kinase
VTIHARPSKREHRIGGELEVVNEGPAIPPEVLPRIFDRFSGGPESGGLGLGLYLAKRIADAHGGS